MPGQVGFLLRWLVAPAIVVCSLAAAQAAEPARAYGFSPATRVGYDWNGFYAGVFGGLSRDAAQGALPGAHDAGDAGVLGGVVAGVSRQQGGFVFGAEVDLAMTGNDVATTAGGGPLSVGTTWISTLRGRAGINIENLFVYGTAGIALGDVEVAVPTGSDHSIAAGWVAGAGIEFPIGERFTARAEYLYSDLGSVDGNAGGTAFDTQFDSHQVRAGITYKFR